MKNLSTKWQKFIAYLTAYLGIIPFLIGGGAILFKSEDEPAKKSVKMAFLLFVPFVVIEFIFALITGFMQYGAYSGYIANYGPIYLATAIVSIIKFVAFTVAFILDTFTMIKFDCIISLFGGMPKTNKTVPASKHSAGAAYTTKVLIVKDEEEDATEETNEDDAE